MCEFKKVNILKCLHLSRSASNPLTVQVRPGLCSCSSLSDVARCDHTEHHSCGVHVQVLFYFINCSELSAPWKGTLSWMFLFGALINGFKPALSDKNSFHCFYLQSKILVLQFKTALLLLRPSISNINDPVRACRKWCGLVAWINQI